MTIYTNKDHTIISHEGKSIPAVAGNRDYDKLVSKGVEIGSYVELKKTPLDIIQGLEAAITPRRTREAILGTDDGWLVEQEALISAERSKL